MKLCTTKKRKNTNILHTLCASQFMPNKYANKYLTDTSW